MSDEVEAFRARVIAMLESAVSRLKGSDDRVRGTYICAIERIRDLPAREPVVEIDYFPIPNRSYTMKKDDCIGRCELTGIKDYIKVTYTDGVPTAVDLEDVG